MSLDEERRERGERGVTGSREQVVKLRAFSIFGRAAELW